MTFGETWGSVTEATNYYPSERQARPTFFKPIQNERVHAVFDYIDNWLPLDVLKAVYTLPLKNSAKILEEVEANKRKLKIAAEAQVLLKPFKFLWFINTCNNVAALEEGMSPEMKKEFYCDPINIDHKESQLLYSTGIQKYYLNQDMEIPYKAQFQQIVRKNGLPWFYDIKKGMKMYPEFTEKINSNYFNNVLQNDKFLKFVDQFIKQEGKGEQTRISFDLINANEQLKQMRSYVSKKSVMAAVSTLNRFFRNALEGVFIE